MEVKIEIILTPNEYQELEKKCNKARKKIAMNGEFFGVGVDKLLEACTPKNIIKSYQESFSSEGTLDDFVRDLFYECLSKTSEGIR